MNANLDPRQLVLAAIAFLVPMTLLLARRERALLAWVCFTLGIQLLDTSIVTNLPAARIVGLLLVPRALSMLRIVRRIPIGRVIILQFVYLAVLGIIFGFLIPWPSGEIDRAFNQIAPGRATIYLIRSVADISLTLFVARQLISRRQPGDVLRYVLVGTTIASLSGLLEYITAVDWYGRITGLVPLNLPYRMRGFMFEPRALGLIAVQGMMICLVLYGRRRKGGLLAVAGIHAAAVFLSGSTSAIAVLLVATLAVFASDARYRASIMAPIVVTVVVIGTFITMQPQYFDTYVRNVILRLTLDRIEEEGRPESVTGDVAARMDVLDGPPVLFLAANPAYIVTGTGPGLMSLPAAKYIPDASFYNEVRERGINSPPSSGILLEVSNAGLIGLGMWFIIVLGSIRAFRILAIQADSRGQEWSAMKSAFVAISASYLVQASASPIWPVFMGLGLGAAHLALAQQRRIQTIGRGRIGRLSN